MKMKSSPEGLLHRDGGLLHQEAGLLEGGLLHRARLGPEGLGRLALYCPICFGASDAPMAVGMNWGVLTLLGVTAVVLGSFAMFFVRLIRRADSFGPAKAGPHTRIPVAAGFSRPDTRTSVEAGFSRPDTAAGDPS